jgi:hypothetical protein
MLLPRVKNITDRDIYRKFVIEKLVHHNHVLLASQYNVEFIVKYYPQYSWHESDEILNSLYYEGFIYRKGLNASIVEKLEKL